MALRIELILRHIKRMRLLLFLGRLRFTFLAGFTFGGLAFGLGLATFALSWFGVAFGGWRLLLLFFFLLFWVGHRKIECFFE